MAFPLAQMEEESYQQAKKDEETEKRYRQDFDDWWARYKETAKKWWKQCAYDCNKSKFSFIQVQ